MPYRFAEFEFDPDRGLLRAGEELPLEPLAAELLRHLIENRGRIVTDAAISTQVRAVRRALGDDREQQRFVRTHPRRGYSFIAEVEATGAADLGAPAAAAGTAAAPPPAARPRRPTPAARRPALLAPVLAIAVVALAALGVWSWTGGPGGPGGPGGESESAGAARDLSIVVLPFANLSADASRDYIADAFTEDLITDLSRIRDAFVISRSTSFTYRGAAVEAGRVARELGVRYVLEGSLRIDGDRVRINAQLVDGTDQSQIWADRYDRPLAELFDLQDNVTGRIASVLRAELRRADSARQDPELGRDAWDHALRGNVLLYNHQTITDYQEAHALLSRAVELDPGIASAWGGLAFVHFIASAAPIPGITRPDSAELSLEAALKATEADPMNAEPWWLVGAGHARTGHPERGMSACETAIELNPNMDCGHVCAGLVHMSLGKPEQAVPYFRHALELNPRFRPFTKEKYLGLAHLQAGRLDLAIAALNRALAKAPQDGFANLAMAAALALDGQTDAAEGVLARHIERAGGSPPTVPALRQALGWLGPGVERMLAGLERAGLPGG